MSSRPLRSARWFNTSEYYAFSRRAWLRSEGFTPAIFKEGKPIIFLGWAPHPMNSNFKMTYLSGGDDVFGPNYGGATVYTNVRAGYTEECPNVGKLVKNLVFSLPMENEIMGKILNDSKDPEVAATEWLKANPTALTPWLDGVTTKDGGDGLAAVKAKLGL